ncbi:hypothetical protein WOLCODRAFT_140115 [Wolfiporia cocos MD-104 SS10]|uniref:Uncharacterized protein n=1 Tax=Wolfiporia cocos (strain MD-104) TaxID=742152 RepID=A0A2H3J0T9_WOLCO|nr:hypothetical protein WOLCODRAFT_140115 [Wolfiporia cocos MD-104 SS10]
MQSRQIMPTPASPPQSASAPLKKQRRKSASHGGRMSSVVARSHHVSSEDVEHLASAFDSLVDAGTSIASTVIQAKQNKRDDDVALILRSLYNDASTATDDNTQYGSEAFSLGSIFSGIGKLVGTVAKHSKDIENVGSAVESVADAGSTIASVVEQAHQSSQTAQA